jgi:hypothetical protein
LDQHIDEVLPVIAEPITENGVFHTKLHFSSSRATVWLLDDPYRYRILGFEALSDPDVCLALPQHRYPAKAVIPPGDITKILDGFRRLRFADDIIYLRAGSLNIFNGMISLNFIRRRIPLPVARGVPQERFTVLGERGRLMRFLSISGLFPMRAHARLAAASSCFEPSARKSENAFVATSIASRTSGAPT